MSQLSACQWHLVSARTTAKQWLVLPLTGCVLWLTAGCTPQAELPPEVQRELVAVERPEKVGSNSAQENTLLSAAQDEGNSSRQAGAQQLSGSESASTSTQPKDVARQPEPCLVNEKPWIQISDLPWKSAEVHYVGAIRVGFGLMTIDRSELADNKQIVTRRIDVTDRNDDGSLMPTRQTTLETVEKLTGELVSFRYTETVDEETIQSVEGRNVFGQIDMTRKEGSGSLVRSKWEWPKEYWGPHGVLESVRRAPMSPGDRRKLKIYLPRIQQFVDVALEALQVEVTPVGDGQALSLLHVSALFDLPSGVQRLSYFINEKGVVLKSILQSRPPVYKFQVAEEVVQRLDDQAKFSLGLATRVPLSGNLKDLANASQAVYHLQSSEIDPYDMLISNSKQKLRSISPAVCEVLRIASQPAQDTNQSDQLVDSTIDAEDQPVTADSQSSPLIPSDRPSIAELASEILGDQSVDADAAIKANKLCEGLRRLIKVRPIETEIVSTLVVARDRVASCIECANLLAAVLREQQIPCRLVIGIRAESDRSDCQLHVWNQAWVNGAWLDLDASTSGGVDLGYIAMSTNSGSSSNQYAHCLQVLKSMRVLSGVSLESVQ